MSQLQKKFLRHFLAIGVIPTLFIGALILSSTFVIHKQDIYLIEEMLLNQKAAEISRFFDTTFRQLELVIGYADLAPPKPEQQLFFLQSIKDDNPAIKDISFICVLASHCSVGKETARQVSGLPKAPLRLWRESEAFQRASQGENHISAVTFIGFDPRVTITQPVINRDQKIIAVLMAELSLQPIQVMMQNARLGQTGYLYLRDAEGRTIAHAREAKLGQIFSPQEDVLRFSRELVNFQWQFIAEWPLREVNQILWSTLRRIVGIIGIVSLLVFAISYLMARGFLEPIRRLVEGAKKIGQGKLETRVNIKTGDELELLGEQFNQMASNLVEVERLRDVEVEAKALAKTLEKEKELSQAKDRFLTTISHQLNTPVTQLHWALESLPVTSADASPAQASIRESAQSIQQIVADTLFLTELGLSYKAKHFQPIDLSSLIKNCLNGFQTLINDKHLKVNLKPLEVAMVSGERVPLEHLFKNIIENAIIFNQPNGAIDITLSQNKETVTVKITDTGIGISLKEQGYIGKEIFRGQNAIIGKNVGTGMGLLIARLVAEGHGGWLNIKSAEDQGTTVEIILPRSEVNV